jgi:threonine dehydratase
VSAAAGLPPELDYRELELAHRRSAEVARHTPVLTAASLSQRCGGTVALKAENLQRTGSFKLRGALNKLRSVGGAAGVVAGSAGNHAQSLAYAARASDVPCEVFMPVDAAVSKLAAVRAFGATVHQEGGSVDECVELARRRAAEGGLTFVHPFDDLEVVAGQAGVGVELLDDLPDLAVAIVAVGGGGLMAGVAAAIKQRRPDVRVVGVQAERCAPFPDSLQTGEVVVAPSVATIADGIAIKRPGGVTLPLVRGLVDDFVTVTEDAIAEAMVFLLERSKLVVEGAGAAALAAVLSGAVQPAEQGTTGLVLSGGNVDVGLLAAVAARQETRHGRRLRLYTRVFDRPGGLAALLAAVAATNANLLAVDHVRDGVDLDVRETGIELTLETRGRDHAEAVVGELRAQGYELEEL